MKQFADATIEEINDVMEKAVVAFEEYKRQSISKRAALMRNIAAALESTSDELIKVAMRETNLPEARLRGEKARTIFQLNSYADACEQGHGLDARIDTAIATRTPPRPDIRKMMVPLGPVVVFGASNFPFAYSTAGGDTASALAAGCSVIVKAHPAHAETSEMVAAVIHKALADSDLPKEVFSHVHGRSFDIGKALVLHPETKAVGFTGSFTGGKQLFDWAATRPVPIPVFAEMGSVNPVYLFPAKLSAEAKDIAEMYTASVTLGVGQFCTNPGLIIGIEDDALHRFIKYLGDAITNASPARMLHAGIAEAYAKNKAAALSQQGVEVAGSSSAVAGDGEGSAAVASVDAKTFLQNSLLHKEVFGPFTLVIRCSDESEMMEVIKQMEGQLTSTIMATPEELKNNDSITRAIAETCGRLIFNGVPTGVEVCWSMQHGGPFPASTDSRFTAVGPDAIKRFCRPQSFQSWPDELLPEALQDSNPLQIWRMLNNDWTRAAVTVNKPANNAR